MLSFTMNQSTTLKVTLLSALVLTGITLPPSIAEARRNRPKDKPQAVQKVDKNVPGKFDFYSLTLSWSPDYCATKGGRDIQQCGSGKQLGFVLHGLWPQYNQGYPADCTQESFDPKMMDQFPNLYPSEKLYSHEWEKHGTCSGLTQVGYHELAKNWKDRFKVPDRYQKPAQPFRVTPQQFKKDLIKANPGLTANGIAPTCSGSGRFLQEVQICYAKDGSPIDCSANVLKRSKSSCGQADFLVRSVR